MFNTILSAEPFIFSNTWQTSVAMQEYLETIHRRTAGPEVSNMQPLFQMSTSYGGSKVTNEDCEQNDTGRL